MRSVRWIRPAALLTAAAAITAAGLSGVGTAAAAPAPTFTVEGVAVASGTFATFTYTIDVADGPVTSATFTTDQDAGLPADDGSLTGLRVDRAKPTGATRTGKDLTVALANLVSGRHTVSFPVELPTSGAARTTHSSATLSDGTTPVDSNDVPLAINSPDLVLTYDDQSDSPSGTVPLGLGRGGEIDYDVTNIGTSPADAQLVLTVPTGMALSDDNPIVSAVGDNDPTAVPCTTSGSDPLTVVCELGVVGPRTTALVVAVTVVGTAQGVPGTTANYTAAVRTKPGDPDDSDVGNNSLPFTVRFTGEARLTTTVTAPATELVVGQTERITVTVRNDGPQDATGTFGLATVLGENTDPENPELSIIGFDGASDSGQIPFNDYRSPIRAHLNSRLAPHEVSFKDLFRNWSIGTLTPGASLTAHFTVKALRRGAGSFGVVAASEAGDTRCPVFDDNADPNAQYPCAALQTITVVAAPPAHRPTGNGSVPLGNGTGTNGTGSSLANTGSPTVPLSLMGLALLLGGALLTRAGRRVSA